MAIKLPNLQHIPELYKQIQYPGQRRQVDVKLVLTAYLTRDVKGKNFIRTYLWMSTIDFSTWNPLRNITPIFHHLISYPN